VLSDVSLNARVNWPEGASTALTATWFGLVTRPTSHKFGLVTRPSRR
jgi:hypothetical protein